MGVYELWRKMKLEELDKTKRLSILNELNVGYRKMRNALLPMWLFGMTGLSFPIVGLGVDLSTGLSCGTFGLILLITCSFFVFGYIFMTVATSEVEAEMQKELEEK